MCLGGTAMRSCCGDIAPHFISGRDVMGKEVQLEGKGRVAWICQGFDEGLLLELASQIGMLIKIDT